MILSILASVLATAYFILILLYSWKWNRISQFRIPNGFTPATRLSVIIPARNEEEHISRCLDSLIGQHYPSNLLEIIVVDDDSSDRTASIVRSYSQTWIKIIPSASDRDSHPSAVAYKKTAIATGIRHATGTLMVCTDADCTFHPDWLLTLAAFYQNNHPAFIAAPVCLDNRPSPLEIFQALDFLSLQGITAASVASRFHMMCNGANLAYEKDIFMKTGGFEGIDQIASGDDMLLMQKIYRLFPDRVMYCLSQEATVHTRPAQGLVEFLNQRIRWASKATVYTDSKIKAVLLLVYLFNVAMLALLMMSVFNQQYRNLTLGMVLVKTAAELYFLIPVAGFFRKTSWLVWFLPAQPFHILYTVIAGLFGQSGRYTWKGRRVR